jgi:hypothetical protein
MKIILVCVGNFQSYILDNIKNLLVFGNKDIDVIISPEFTSYFDNLNVNIITADSLNDCNFVSNLDKSFRNGFWHFCSLRLFLLYYHIKKNNLQNCIHIENDVMIYENLDNISTKFNKDKISATFDCDKRVIPGIIHIPKHELFEPIIKNYDTNIDDMYNLAKFNENIIEPLPICFDNFIHNKITKHYQKFNCIFDAAAIGQYLGGVDPRNQDGDTRGFINETCLIKYNEYKFFWIKNNEQLYKPYIFYNNNYIPIINLHIHSKILANFMGTQPNESKFIKFMN